MRWGKWNIIIHTHTHNLTKLDTDRASSKYYIFRVTSSTSVVLVLLLSWSLATVTALLEVVPAVQMLVVAAVFNSIRLLWLYLCTWMCWSESREETWVCPVGTKNHRLGTATWSESQHHLLRHYIRTFTIIPISVQQLDHSPLRIYTLGYDHNSLVARAGFHNNIGRCFDIYISWNA